MPDAFTNNEFGLFLKKNNIKKLYLVGLDAAGCVLHTARGAKRNGYDVTIITDSIALKEERKWNELMQIYKNENMELIESKQF
jgi:nicotinamidase-related amidase